MVTRRDLLRVAGAAALASLSGEFASCAAPPAAPRRYRIGFVALAPFDDDPDGGTAFLWKAFLAGLAEHGYVDGQNVEIILRDAGGDIAKLQQVAAEVAALQPDVIVGGQGPASRETVKAIKTIPLISQGPDLVKEGLVASYARPGGNVTGIMFTPTDFAKNVELLSQMFPAARRVGALWWTTQEGQTAGLKRAEEVAPSLGLRIERFEIRVAADFAGAFDAAKRARVDALLNLASPLSLLKRRIVVRLAAEAALPVLYEQRAYVDDGGLASFGPDQLGPWKRVGGYVDKVLKGANPADLPIEVPTKLELVVNLRAANAIGITIPADVLSRASDVLR